MYSGQRSRLSIPMNNQLHRPRRSDSLRESYPGPISIKTVKGKDQAQRLSEQMGCGNLDCETVKYILRVNQEKMGMHHMSEATKELMLVFLAYAIVTIINRLWKIQVCKFFTFKNKSQLLQGDTLLFKTPSKRRYYIRRNSTINTRSLSRLSVIPNAQNLKIILFSFLIFKTSFLFDDH